MVRNNARNEKTPLITKEDFADGIPLTVSIYCYQFRCLSYLSCKGWNFGRPSARVITQRKQKIDRYFYRKMKETDQFSNRIANDYRKEKNSWKFPFDIFSLAWLIHWKEFFIKTIIQHFLNNYLYGFGWKIYLAAIITLHTYNVQVYYWKWNQITSRLLKYQHSNLY